MFLYSKLDETTNTFLETVDSSLVMHLFAECCYDRQVALLRKLPVQIRVFIVDRFQKVISIDATTIFLCPQVLHMSNNPDFMHSAAIKTYLLYKKNVDSPTKT